MTIRNIENNFRLTNNYNIYIIIYSFIGEYIYLSDLVKYENIDFYIKSFIFTKLIIDKIFNINSIYLENNLKLLKQIFNKFKYIELRYNYIELISYYGNLTHLTFKNSFNQKLEDELKELKNLTHLKFGQNFNKKLEDSLKDLKNLTHIIFRFKFNKKLENSLKELKSLIHLEFSVKFNK